MISRAELRGNPLDKECYTANITSHEYGIDDDRVFCYGLFKEQSVTEICNKCLKCKAFVGNATPMKGGAQE